MNPDEKRPRYVNRPPKTLLASMMLGMLNSTLTLPRPQRMGKPSGPCQKFSGRIVGYSPIAPINKSDNDDTFRQRMKSERIRRKRFKTKL
jgi:hypothetical protein